MEIYQAKEIQKDGKATGKWHWTYSNSAGCFPVGYCAQGCPGHDTADEARAHQVHWELDKEVLHHEDKHAQQCCVVCEEWTTHRVTVGQRFPYTMAICEVHDTPENVAKHYRATLIVEEA